MADTKTSNEVSITNPDGTELVRVAKSGSNFKILLSDFRTWTNQNLDEVLAVGNTTSRSAIFTDAGSTTTIAPQGLLIDNVAGGLAFSISDSNLGAAFASMNVTTGEWFWGDIGQVVNASPWMGGVGTTATISSGGLTSTFATFDSSLNKINLVAPAATGLIHLETTSPGVNFFIDNGAKTVEMTLDGGEFTVKDAFASTTGVEIDNAGRLRSYTAVAEIVLTPTSIAGTGGIDFSTTVGAIKFPATGFSLGTTTYTSTSITTVAPDQFTITGGHAINISPANNRELLVTTSGAGKVKLVTDTTGGVNILTLQDFADNAAASGGGLAVGDLYYTNAGGSADLKIVI